MRCAQRRIRLGAFAAGWLIVAALGGPAGAWQDQDPLPDLPQGAQVLTQGPIHEAFAEPIVFDPQPGPVVPKAPPPPINEIPPEQKPEGDNVQWVPGYWAWDDSRGDYLWVSGIWRAIPPGRQWVPGYWQQVADGFQWVPGFWAPDNAAAAPLQYLPEPPPSLENGPNAPQPSPDATWVPGLWVWQDGQYAWRPGFWVVNQPGWMWMPASYSWTPSGYVYLPGYWDYPMSTRGMAFAPVYFSQPVYSQPNFAYSPAVGLLSSALMSSLFVRPAYHSYYFGDYYAQSNYQQGIYPWYSFHGSRYGYDPLYAYAAMRHYRTDPQWAEQLHETYRYRREHPEARPAHTFADMRAQMVNPPAGAGPAGRQNLVLARHIDRLAAANQQANAAQSNVMANTLRLQRIDEAQRQQLARQASQVHAFREDRLRREQEARGDIARQNLQQQAIRQQAAQDRAGQRQQEAATLKQQEAATLKQQEAAALKQQQAAALQQREQANTLKQQEAAALRQQQADALQKQREAALQKQQQAAALQSQQREAVLQQRQQQAAALQQQREAALQQREQAAVLRQQQQQLQQQQMAPRQLQLPRSPIFAPAGQGQQFNPPGLPQHPQFNPNIQPGQPNPALQRHEPGPEVRPPAPFMPPGQRRR